MRRVCHPAAGFNLIGIEAPIFQFGFEQWATNIRGIVQFTGTVVVEDLGENARVSIEVVFVEDRVIVGEGFSKARETCGWYLLQRRFVLTGERKAIGV